MNEFQAAMGICNLRHLDDEIAKRKKVAEQYRKHLAGIKGIKLNDVQQDVQSNYAYFPVVFDGYKYTRDEVFEKGAGRIFELLIRISMPGRTCIFLPCALTSFSTIS